jgi:flagella basal body P-ring formation protein FlgA
MKRTTHRGCLLVALTGVMSQAMAADAPDELLRRLGEQRPDVMRWEIQTAVDGERQATPAVPVVDIGRISARTALRYADGRVRWYRVAGFRPVAVTRRPVAAGEAIDASAVTSLERDVVGLACLPVTLDSADRWRATRRLTTGDVLCADSVEPAPDVERDRLVTLSTERGAISVSRSLIATRDANPGEQVRLRDRATGATVIAIVTGRGAARIPENK